MTDVGSWTTRWLRWRRSTTTVRLEIDRIVRQRNTLLKQAGGRLTAEIEVTLDVWDKKFAEVADQFGYARATLVARLTPMVHEAYEQLAGTPTPLDLRYEPEWRPGRPRCGADDGQTARCPSGREHRRPASRRTADDHQRTPEPHACIAG